MGLMDPALGGGGPPDMGGLAALLGGGGAAPEGAPPPTMDIPAEESSSDPVESMRQALDLAVLRARAGLGSPAQARGPALLVTDGNHRVDPGRLPCRAVTCQKYGAQENGYCER